MQLMGMSDGPGATVWSQGGGGSRINLTSPKAMPCPPPPSQFDKYQNVDTERERLQFPPLSEPLCLLSAFCRVFSCFCLSLRVVDGFWHLRTSTVIDWHWLELTGWIIPRNAPDRYY